MKKENFERLSDPSLVKFVETANRGMTSIMLHRIAINYILKGRKQVYCGDLCTQIDEGDVLLYDTGIHYEENTAAEHGTFEQLTFYVSPAMLQTMILGQHTYYGTDYSNNHSCERCQSQNFIVEHANYVVREFFGSINRSLSDTYLRHDATNHRIKLGELLYMILSGDDCCLKAKILNNTDATSHLFSAAVYTNIFNEISLESLAATTNRSLTSFKKEFRRQFNTSPHKWFIDRRLDRSRMLLISTNKTIAEIGTECAFTNISHFIKLFKQRFHSTPAVFRQQHLTTDKKQPT
ncbi:MAG: helix-turn-helix transcriptional regulator [Alistipes sp.]